MKEKLAGSPVRSSEDVSQRVYLYEGLLGETDQEGPWHWRKAGLSRGRGQAERVAAWLFAGLSADVRSVFMLKQVAYWVWKKQWVKTF